MTKNQVIADILRMMSVEYEKRKSELIKSADNLDQTRREFIEKQVSKKVFGDALSLVMEYAEKEMGLPEHTVFAMREGKYNGA